MLEINGMPFIKEAVGSVLFSPFMIGDWSFLKMGNQMAVENIFVGRRNQETTELFF